ncbi:NUDIX domain-containing protein [Marinobacterium sp. AK62]|uniref:ADP-ribose pyrophosphatase n=1 Tax=Marinobacterium alkalitolerans TaxID=1542925 RepID=A0ABS3Z920_9GAMM|nr:NUDIX domain-containing protein [Marinobacterium alkalitolerans]MBP0048207.1 NUDIX domain-containing protein [Marinobacterium alkalitolerans]
MSERWQPSFDERDVRLEQDEPLYDGFFRLHRLSLSHPKFEGGRVRIQREILDRGDAVCVLLYDPARDAVVLVEQFRAGALGKTESPWLLELVAGIVEPGESAEAVARRESQEEAGVELGPVFPITGYLPSPGGCDEWIDLMCALVDAQAAGGVHGLDSEGEDIKVHVIAAQDAFALVRENRLRNAAAIIALQWLELNHGRLQAMRVSDEA